MLKHYNIPVFLPEMACPFRCIYCDQQKITGADYLISRKEVIQLVDKYLLSFPHKHRHVEIAFFGGNFTGLREETQRYYLSVAKQYIDKGLIQGIRLSTRPDYISQDRLDLLSEYGVTSIELGAQSLDDEVLLKCGRGHTTADVEYASKLIKQQGFRLGLQMMVGLPGDSPAKSIQTAKKIIALSAHESRIYPCLVVGDTQLHKLFETGQYQPLSLSEAVNQAADLLLIFEMNGVKVIRIGLHPSDEINNKSLIAGPFHPAFKTMVLSEIWNRRFDAYTGWPLCDQVLVEVPPNEINFAIGFNRSNKTDLKQRYKRIQFRTNKLFTRRNFQVYPLPS